MTNMRRREALTVLAGAGSFVLPRISIGKPGRSANEKVNIAMIGCANIAKMALGGCDSENIVAICDVDERHFDVYAKEFPQIEKAKRFTDFRVMFDKMGKEIDGVCINTPDHTHFVATIDAMQRGMHVCTQKPLTHNVWQARTLLKAKEKYKVITNMANQGHTTNGIRQMREMYEAGLLGTVKEVYAGFPGGKGRSSQKYPYPKMPVPAGLDWDLWLGPNTPVPYNEAYHPYEWRTFVDFGTGIFGDWFCHIADGPVWGMGLYEPTVIECVQREDPSDGRYPASSVIRFDFPKEKSREACSLYWYNSAKDEPQFKRPADWSWDHNPNMGSYWHGSKASVFLDNRSNNPIFTSKEKMKEFKESGGVAEKYPRVKAKGPHEEWVQAIRGDGPEPGSNFEYSARLSEVGALGVLAQRFGGRIEWDAKKATIKYRPDLNKYLKDPVRKGWEYGDDLWRK